MRGPSTVRCGTPDFTGSLQDTWFYIELLVGFFWLAIALSKVTSNFIVLQLTSNRLCGTLSKALQKSRKTMSTCFLLSIAL